jgi:hypothetical protein
MPALAEREVRLELARKAVQDVMVDGRVNKTKLTTTIAEQLETLPVAIGLIEQEGRKHIAEQLVSGWANKATIKLDRDQRLPVYQARLGFEGSFFKVGSTFVLPSAMTTQDFETMIDRIDRRVKGAQDDRAILSDFYERAKPGLEAGQNLVAQFEAGTLELYGANGDEELEPGDDEEGEEPGDDEEGEA